VIQQMLGDAFAALDRGDWPRAQNLGGRLLQLAPRLPSAYLIAGVAALRQQQFELAVAYLRQATQLDPANANALAELARALVSAGDVAGAVAAADAAMALAPAHPVTCDTLGVVYGQAEFHAKAGQAFARAVELQPDNTQLRYNLASSLQFAGELDQARAQYEACVQLDPGHGRAHLSLAQASRHTPQDNHVARLQSGLAAGPDRETRMYLHLALAKELEDLGDYAQAFQHLTAGKAAGGEGRGYQAQRDAAMVDNIIGCFPEPIAASGLPTREPIFVIGMPRTGTTLVERILSSHPQVQAAGELRAFLMALYQETGTVPADPAFPERMPRIDWTRLGQRYLAGTRPLTGHAPHFVDKLPHNFLHAGFIAAALPQARIVCLRRDPVDTCLGNFRQLFDLRSPYFDYSFDLLDTGRFYLQFDRLMAHWQRVLPGRVLEIGYEDLVDRQEPVTRELLEFCDLRWDEACLRFQDNAAPVATASAVQVRAPLNRAGIGRWRRYEAQLAPLLDLLAQGGVSPGT
jgi:tetratricopeptide (TPR) repeat protein